MKIQIELEDYRKGEAISLKWEKGFGIEVKAEEGTALIRANRAGLVSLANHLLTLAQDQVPAGMHIHLDEYNSLKEGSEELIIERTA